MKRFFSVLLLVSMLCLSGVAFAGGSVASYGRESGYFVAPIGPLGPFPIGAKLFSPIAFGYVDTPYYVMPAQRILSDYLVYQVLVRNNKSYPIPRGTVGFVDENGGIWFPCDASVRGAYTFVTDQQVRSTWIEFRGSGWAHEGAVYCKYGGGDGFVPVPIDNNDQRAPEDLIVERDELIGFLSER